jgi:hypothetical protein
MSEIKENLLIRSSVSALTQLEKCSVLGCKITYSCRRSQAFCSYLQTSCSRYRKFVTCMSDHRRDLDWWPDLLHTLIQRVTTLNSSLLHTHACVHSHISISRCLVAAFSGGISWYSLGAGHIENAASSSTSIVVRGQLPSNGCCVVS